MTSNHLAALLSALQTVQSAPDPEHTHVVILPPVPPPAPIIVPPSQAAHPGRSLRTLAGPLARQGLRQVFRHLVRPIASRVLRHSALRKFALRFLARFPGLHTRAYGIMFPPAAVIAAAELPPDPVLGDTLSPRARTVARRLARLSGMPQGSPGLALPALGDHADWDRFVATTQAMLIARGAGAMPARARLAFVSPLPPERTGIAEYAAQLLPALCVHFDITLIVEQATLELPPLLSALPVHDSAWLSGHADEFDEILYQIGNSEFHSHMFDLLRDHPGVVVLHDFFLGNVMAYRQVHNDPADAWTNALFHSHGYPALLAYQQAGARPALLKSHPCNLAVLEGATRVIVHSDHAAVLARAWYGAHATDYWNIVPLPRAQPPVHDPAAARAALRIAPNVLLVCSFGYIGQNKLTDRLLAAWMASSLHADPQCLLVLVGANHDSPFGLSIDETVRAAGAGVRIAGWTDDHVYRQYLQAADIGVQLRTSAQGETSAAVLDCMNYGLPTIVNANGSMADLPEQTVWRLPDVFADAALVAALETLRHDGTRRVALGQRAAQLLADGYRPEHCSLLYRSALELARADAPRSMRALEQALAPLCTSPEERLAAASAIARLPARLPARQLLVDASQLHLPHYAYARDELAALLTGAQGWRIEPVLLVQEDGQWRLRYARTLAAGILGFAWSAPDDPVVDVDPGDLFYAPVPNPDIVMAHGAGLWRGLRAQGTAFAFAVPPNAPSDELQAWRACVKELANLLVFSDIASVAWLGASMPDYNNAC